MTKAPGTMQLRDMVHEAILNNLNLLDPLNTDMAVRAVMKITESVHQNALAYGRLCGEKAVLDSVLDVGVPEAALHAWRVNVQDRIEAGS